MTNREWSTDLDAVAFSAADAVQQLRLVGTAVRGLAAAIPSDHRAAVDLAAAAAGVREAVELIQCAAEELLNLVSDDAVAQAEAEGETCSVVRIGALPTSSETVEKMNHAIRGRVPTSEGHWL